MRARECPKATGVSLRNVSANRSYLHQEIELVFDRLGRQEKKEDEEEECEEESGSGCGCGWGSRWRPEGQEQDDDGIPSPLAAAAFLQAGSGLGGGVLGSSCIPRTQAKLVGSPRGKTVVVALGQLHGKLDRDTGSPPLSARSTCSGGGGGGGRGGGGGTTPLLAATPQLALSCLANSRATTPRQAPTGSPCTPRSLVSTSAETRISTPRHHKVGGHRGPQWCVGPGQPPLRPGSNRKDRWRWPSVPKRHPVNAEALQQLHTNISPHYRDHARRREESRRRKEEPENPYHPEVSPYANRWAEASERDAKEVYHNSYKVHKEYAEKLHLKRKEFEQADVACLQSPEVTPYANELMLQKTQAGAKNVFERNYDYEEWKVKRRQDYRQELDAKEEALMKDPEVTEVATQLLATLTGQKVWVRMEESVDTRKRKLKERQQMKHDEELAGLPFAPWLCKVTKDMERGHEEMLNFFEQHLATRNGKVKQLHRKLQEQELSACTFQPKVTQRSGDLVSRRFGALEAHKRLHMDSMRRQGRSGDEHRWPDLLGVAGDPWNAQAAAAAAGQSMEGDAPLQAPQLTGKQRAMIAEVSSSQLLHYDEDSGFVELMKELIYQPRVYKEDDPSRPECAKPVDAIATQRCVQDLAEIFSILETAALEVIATFDADVQWQDDEHPAWSLALCQARAEHFLSALAEQGVATSRMMMRVEQLGPHPEISPVDRTLLFPSSAAHSGPLNSFPPPASPSSQSHSSQRVPEHRAGSGAVVSGAPSFRFLQADLAWMQAAEQQHLERLARATARLEQAVDHETQLDMTLGTTTGIASGTRPSASVLYSEETTAGNKETVSLSLADVEGCLAKVGLVRDSTGPRFSKTSLEKQELEEEDGKLMEVAAAAAASRRSKSAAALSRTASSTMGATVSMGSTMGRSQRRSSRAASTARSGKYRDAAFLHGIGIFGDNKNARFGVELEEAWLLYT
mmetsp:Transcript_68180/g.142482  ORF Transcript_68180/g.142482 Transcript_68180/m.142482 type:complete len:968 (+) Transcript_68180:40-2943(+)